jgi:UDP-N-acetyl-D-glucosamine dehydrogenase
MPQRTRPPLRKRLADGNAAVGVVGLGYVGLPLALRLSEVGYRVLGFDTDPVKARRLHQGRSYINYITGARVRRALEQGFAASADFSRAAEADAICICVPTPLTQHREPDLQYVESTARTLATTLRRGQLIVLESTTFPGTTEEIVRPILESSGLRAGRDFHLAYSPERVDPGNPQHDTRSIPRLVGGLTPACTKAACALYGRAVDRVVPVRSPRVAEMAKLLENIHRAVNIGLVNEMKLVADAMGMDIFEVVDAAATKPFGFVPYYPGPGLGGHCIPIDPFYLTWKAREYGVHTRFIELAGEINRAMPQWVVHKVTQALNAGGKAVRGARILVIGIAYKKDVDDLRESPALELMDLLHDLGAKVDYHDPLIPRIPPLRRGRYDKTSVKLSPRAIAGYDLVLIATNHSAVDYDVLATHARCIVDTRGQYRAAIANVVRA